MQVENLVTDVNNMRADFQGVIALILEVFDVMSQASISAYVCMCIYAYMYICMIHMRVIMYVLWFCLTRVEAQDLSKSAFSSCSQSKWSKNGGPSKWWPIPESKATSVCVRVHIYIYILYTHIYHIHIYSHIYIYIFSTHIHIYIYTHMYIYIYMYMWYQCDNLYQKGAMPAFLCVNVC